MDIEAINIIGYLDSFLNGSWLAEKWQNDLHWDQEFSDWLTKHSDFHLNICVLINLNIHLCSQKSEN